MSDEMVLVMKPLTINIYHVLKGNYNKKTSVFLLHYKICAIGIVFNNDNNTTTTNNKCALS